MHARRLVVLLALCLLAPCVRAVDWTNKTSVLPVAAGWRDLACSSDGLTCIGVIVEGSSSGGFLTKTRDGGQTWEKESAPAAPQDVRFEAIASSADGTKFAVVGQMQKIWLFEEGATPEWTEVGIKKKWNAVASSADGAVLVAGVQHGNLWTSSNSGMDWVEVKNTGAAKTWTSLATSADGVTMIAAAHSGNLWISNNSGANWTEMELTEKRSWVGVAASSDGAKLVALMKETVMFGPPATRDKRGRKGHLGDGSASQGGSRQ